MRKIRRPRSSARATASVSEFRARLSDFLARVRAGEEVVITSRGVPVAKLVPVTPGDEASAAAGSGGPRAERRGTSGADGSEARREIALFRRLLGLARPYRMYFAALALLGLVASPIALMTPVPVKIAVDSVIGSDPLPGFLAVMFPRSVVGSPTALLAGAVALLMLVALVGQLQSLGYTLLKTYLGEKLVLDFRARLFHHAQVLSLSYHDTKGTGDALYRIDHDAPAVRDVLVEGAIPFVSAVATIGAMLYVMVRLDWQLTLVALSVSPLLLLLAATHRRRMRAKSREVKKLESRVLSTIQETLASLRVVKVFGQEQREAERYVQRAGEGLAARMRLRLIQGRYGLLLSLVTAGGLGIVLYIGVTHVLSGSLSVGELLMVMTYLGQLYSPIKTVSRKAASFQTHLAGAERAFGLLDESRDVPERPDALPLRRAAGAFSVQAVSFGYEPDQLVLQDVSFDIEPGTRVALLGTTGSGKTTLVSLLTRLYDPTAGAILLDGVDLRAYRLADLRRQFSVVLQHPVLFSTTIAENIAYGRPDARPNEIAAAAEAAGAHQFITALPQGYETPVGESGMKLSGGERQRVALARAFLRDSPILVLDEPTSSVDLATEAFILQALERLMEARTVFLITHRLSPVAACDVQLHLRHGRLMEVAPATAGSSTEAG